MAGLLLAGAQKALLSTGINCTIRSLYGALLLLPVTFGVGPLFLVGPIN